MTRNGCSTSKILRFLAAVPLSDTKAIRLASGDQTTDPSVGVVAVSRKRLPVERMGS